MEPLLAPPSFAPTVGWKNAAALPVISCRLQSRLSICAGRLWRPFHGYANGSACWLSLSSPIFLPHAGNQAGGVRLYDVNVACKRGNGAGGAGGSGKSVVRNFLGHSQSINDLAFHSLEYLATASDDCTAQFFMLQNASGDGAGERATWKIQESHAVQTLSIHPSGGYALLGTVNPVIRLYVRCNNFKNAFFYRLFIWLPMSTSTCTRNTLAAPPSRFLRPFCRHPAPDTCNPSPFAHTYLIFEVRLMKTTPYIYIYILPNA